VGGLEHLLIGRQRQACASGLLRAFGLFAGVAHQAFGFALVLGKMAEQDFRVAVLEVVGGLFHFVLVVHVTVGQAARLAVLLPFGPDQVVDVLDLLQVHRQTLDAVGDFAGDRLAVDAANLLEVGELRHFHAVEPDFPAQAPSAERRIFPVVLDEADVVLLEVRPSASSEPRYSSRMFSGAGLSTTWYW
jgi:hypothetical protein